MKKLLCLLLVSLSVGVNAMDSESELSKVQVFTSDNEYGKIEINSYYMRFCIEGIQYISMYNSKSSFTVMVNKYGKPLRCEIMKGN